MYFQTEQTNNCFRSRQRVKHDSELQYTCIVQRDFRETIQRVHTFKEVGYTIIAKTTRNRLNSIDKGDC